MVVELPRNNLLSRRSIAGTLNSGQQKRKKKTLMLRLNG
jgi:hypothetical protein